MFQDVSTDVTHSRNASLFVLLSSQPLILTQRCPIFSSERKPQYIAGRNCRAYFRLLRHFRFVLWCGFSLQRMEST